MKSFIHKQIPLLIMRLILAHRDNIKKRINVVYTLPNQNISENILNNIRIIYESVKEELNSKEMVIYDYGSYLTYLCKIGSAWFKNSKETMILSLYFEEHENTKLFEDILEEAVYKLSEIPNLAKIFYINTPHADNETYTVFGKVIRILKKCFFQANKLHSTYNLGIAEVLILGDKSSGKSSIVDYLIHKSYIPQTAPTLTPQVFNLVFEETDFRVLDICCEDHVKEVFDDHPLELGKLPQAIVYIVDATLKQEEYEDSINRFNEWMDYLQSKYPPFKFQEIPILVLFNKIDLNPTFDFDAYREKYKREGNELNTKYDTSSAYNGQGLFENFRWVVNHVKVTQHL